jgi:hypothetical protein
MECQTLTKIITLSNAELITMLHRIFLLIGLRKVQYPTPEEDIFNVAFIKKNFGHKLSTEIIEAFELAVTGKLDVDVKHYDQFTLPYFCKIMDAYRIFNNERILATPPPKLKEIAYQMTDEERLQEIEEWRKKDYDFKILPLYLYDWLLKYSLHAITDDLKADYYQRAVRVHENELRRNFELFGEKQPYADFLKLKANNFEKISDKDLSTINNIFKRIFINEYLKK